MTSARRIAAVIVATISLAGAADQPASPTWYFAVSGDSRNCGDVVMPGIAADAIKHNVSFYWHLGDLRKISGPDEDFIEERTREGKGTDLADYEKNAWPDFIENQVKPWGETPVFLGIGNHETTKPKTRAAFLEQFHDLLNRPELKLQRLKDDPTAESTRTYFHWVMDGIDFIYLDNATHDQFDEAQMQWLEGVLRRDAKDDTIHTIVTGMHEALPESISSNHSMNEYDHGIKTGRMVYEWLLKMQNESHKTVYVLASHSHYFMEGIFNTPYWQEHGGVLPGWIVGTAGAQRYALPHDKKKAKQAKTNVYGFLLATVNPSGEPAGTIRFKFEQLKENGIPPEVVERFTHKFVHECFVANRKTGPIE